jgi:acetyl esterase/lipase
MPLISDITINRAKFAPNSVTDQTIKFNEFLVKRLESAPKWFEVRLSYISASIGGTTLLPKSNDDQVGAANYREMRLRGETAFPMPTPLPQATDIEIPSREAGRNVPCRLLFPSGYVTSEGRDKTKGTVIHIHGGGWVLGDHKSADALLQAYANAADLAVISVGYLLAPEYPFPRGNEDCIDVADYLVKNSESEYGGPVRFIGGEVNIRHFLINISLLIP